MIDLRVGESLFIIDGTNDIGVIESGDDSGWYLRLLDGELVGPYQDYELGRGEGSTTVLDCGCVPHKTRMTGFGFTCETEDQGYCNFECPHEDDECETCQGEPYLVEIEKGNAEVVEILQPCPECGNQYERETV